ncbi:hypothetical protein BS50DRAFT_492445 [Corynespora cassiicola Philippines]|uniref:intramembrane prenyl-peptidase Rce1 n=1 Tax=Corynespora cassiicola Philippines TaxID=1448308 RepID=A0A2T2NQY8_CORCC|nr:hypothetical protein BS50DRAFT_492445 [Corynespora cassiicola Philippines]
MPPPIKDWASRFSALGNKVFKGAQKPPAISPTTAALLSVVFVLTYVVPFYLSSATRPSPQLSRDAPSSIKARVRAVTFSTLISLAVTVYVLHVHGNASPSDILSWLGCWPVSLLDTARTMLLVAILFAGPLFEHGIVEGEWEDWIRCRGMYNTNMSQGPVSEELIWRALIIPLHVLAQFSGKQIIFLTPLYFGIAHIHHLYEFRLTHRQTPLLFAVLRSLFQFTYTSLFGFFAAFVFVRTGNVFSAILAHSFCNWMGLPRFYGRVGVEAGVPISPPSNKRDDEEDDGPQFESRGVGWTVAYYVILVAGAVGFYWQLFPLTESTHALPVVLVEQ